MTTLVDADAREFAVRRTDLNVMVDAGAGSGKTKILVDRVCQLVDEGVAIRNIAAVTFSEAAASELRDRLRAELSDTHPDQVADLDAAAIERCTRSRAGSSPNTPWRLGCRRSSKYSTRSPRRCG